MFSWLCDNVIKSHIYHLVLLLLFVSIMSGLSVPSLGRIQTVTVADASEAAILNELKAESEENSLPPGNNPLFFRHNTTLDPHGDQTSQNNITNVQKTAGLTAPTMISMQRVSAARVSPDQNHIVFTIKQLDNALA